ncbi:MAG: TadE/TadG family type IV pilus assembly protein [Caulobacteraceae bacterium]
MKRRLKAFARARCGATAVEFALVVGPMLLVMLGVAEFGRFFWTAQSLQRVATRAARCMGLLQSECAAGGVYSASATTAYVQAQAATYGLSLPATAITLNSSATCAGVPGFSTVQVTYAFVSAAPALMPGLAGGTQLNGKACFPNQA